MPPEAGDLTALRIISAESDDLGRYIDLLEEVAEWLAFRGIKQWRPGSFRLSVDYYAESIRLREVQLAFCGEALVDTLRLLLREPIVWPDVVEDDAVYVYNLAVRRTWADQQLGRRLLEWASDRASSLGRRCVRLDCVADNAFLRDYYTGWFCGPRRNRCAVSGPRRYAPAAALREERRNSVDEVLLRVWREVCRD